jgi:hypothetical protein
MTQSASRLLVDALVSDGVAPRVVIADDRADTVTDTNWSESLDASTLTELESAWRAFGDDAQHAQSVDEALGGVSVRTCRRRFTTIEPTSVASDARAALSASSVRAATSTAAAPSTIEAARRRVEASMWCGRACVRCRVAHSFSFVSFIPNIKRL